MNDLINKILKFRNERNWKQFHTLETLSKSIIIEAAELLENFQWSSNPKNLDNVKEEIADIFIYVIELLDLIDISNEDEIVKLVVNKLEINARKYPIELAKDNSLKYNELQKDKK
ncbi:nucleotide pyrophosphohydrolase [Spiroplasma eriocheiris]|uniref:Nucleotide pyrophosphohydrolase n=1 Tax=Spiroplasma eriocheiris TaxID=315358 RepID=A0A0H3XLP6_9MOLU|nr:nucleotide pyrophosphohydrolase [Spiroplasma eriocheiris]AHF58048.1 MazG nucleotide pyrophosphohydrolase [Spiroplasma eriocheiris CCTCC M 207170]AKM54489.1 nucleotide pyrophosphohydrolase [Spiroplasma eriocheiris]